MRGVLGIIAILASLISYAGNKNSLFPGGEYLGEGKYTITNGSKGTYASFVNLNGEDWKLSYLRHNKPMLYNVHLEFTDFGFFIATISERDLGDEAIPHFGNGYCGREQCHLSFDLGDRYVEETITLDPNNQRIKRLGSLNFLDPDGNPHSVFWEENMSRIDSQDSR